MSREPAFDAEPIFATSTARAILVVACIAAPGTVAAFVLLLLANGWL